MTRNRRVFHAQNLATIESMAERGCSAQQIAETIGSTPSSVRVVCSHQKIRLKRGRGYGGLPPSHIEEALQRVVVQMPTTLYAQFARAANAQRKSPSIFASMLLSEIATSDLYKAVLDD